MAKPHAMRLLLVLQHPACLGAPATLDSTSLLQGHVHAEPQPEAAPQAAAKSEVSEVGSRRALWKPEALASFTRAPQWAVMRRYLNPGGHQSASTRHLKVLPDLEDAVLTARHAQLHCSQLLNRDHPVQPYTLAETLLPWTPPVRGVHCNKEAPLVTCWRRDIISKYNLTGDAFGCEHISTRRRSTRLSWRQWRDVATRAGVDPVGKGAAMVRAAMDSQPMVPGISPEREEARLASSPEGRLLIRWLEKLVELDQTHAAAVAYKGHVAARYHTKKGIGPETRLHGWSMAKSILGLLVGKRLDEGGMALDQLARAPELPEEERSGRSMTVRNMLNMRIGRPMSEEHELVQQMLWAEVDTARFADLHPTEIPDPHFNYSSGTANVLSRELRYSFPDGPRGQAEYASYPWRVLFAKIGAGSFACEADTNGTFLFSTFCHATALDWLKIGQLVLNRGTWPATGEEVIPRAWIEASTTPHTDDMPFYTHLWYRLDAGLPDMGVMIAARGILGNDLFVLPELDLVFLRMGSWTAGLLPDETEDQRSSLFTDMLSEFVDEREKA